MPVSQLLVLLPPTRTSRPAAESYSSSPKPSADVSFAPKLQKAKELKSSPKTSSQDSTDADSKTTTDGSTDIDTTTGKDPDPKTTATKAKKSPDSNDGDAETAATKPDASVELADKAVAESNTHVDKKTGKLKANAKPASPKKQAVTGQQSQPGEAGKSKNLSPVAVTASDSGQSNDTAADGDDDSDSVDSTSETVSFGGEFYGSAKIIGRGTAAGDADGLSASASTGQEGNSAAVIATTVGDDPAAATDAEVDSDSVIEKPASATNVRTGTAEVLNALSSPTTGSSASAAKAAAPSSQANFVEENHPKIVESIQGQLLPRGGTMQLQLHPADLGSMQVTVQMKDGVMTASFQTTNEAATKLLTRSLGQLKTGLEAVGVTVEKLHVEQTTQSDAKPDSGDSSNQPSQDQQQQAQQDQQRRELVKQMWKKLSGADPLDLVA